jgi:rare lipoprotein A
MRTVSEWRVMDPLRRSILHTSVTIRWVVLFVSFSLLVSSCAAPTRRVKKKPVESVPGRLDSFYVERGVASWYGREFHGNPTASGEIYNMYDLTAAHRALPLGTRAMVTNLENNRSVEVRINDRGPFVKDRIIDLSYAAAKVIDMVDHGTAQVKIVAFGIREDFRQEPSFYTVQVGSFSEKANAEYLLQEVRRVFQEAYMTVLETTGGNYYRVRVGRFKRREMAYRLAEKLSSMGYAVLITSR